MPQSAVLLVPRRLQGRQKPRQTYQPTRPSVSMRIPRLLGCRICIWVVQRIGEAYQSLPPQSRGSSQGFSQIAQDCDREDAMVVLRVPEAVYAQVSSEQSSSDTPG